MKDPKRLIEPDSEAPEGLRALLGVAKADLPSDAALAALRARLPPPVPPAPPFPTGWIVGAVVPAPAVVVAPVVVPDVVEAPRVGTVESLPPARVVVPKVAAVPASSPVPRAAPVEEPRMPERVGMAGSVSMVAVSDLDRELVLVQKAQGALRSDPADALAAATEHLRQFPSGQLAQEREVVAIEALVALGRGEEAAARAEAFRARWPKSAHLRRIDSLMGVRHSPLTLTPE